MGAKRISFSDSSASEADLDTHGGTRSKMSFDQLGVQLADVEPNKSSGPHGDVNLLSHDRKSEEFQQLSTLRNGIEAWNTVTGQRGEKEDSYRDSDVLIESDIPSACAGMQVHGCNFFLNAHFFLYHVDAVIDQSLGWNFFHGRFNPFNLLLLGR
jgi:hypothetical protein